MVCAGAAVSMLGSIELHTPVSFYACGRLSLRQHRYGNNCGGGSGGLEQKWNKRFSFFEFITKISGWQIGNVVRLSESPFFPMPRCHSVGFAGVPDGDPLSHM